ncbi:MAG: group II intron maturase-specific domain-containing protein [Gelidibacter sp.]
MDKVKRKLKGITKKTKPMSLSERLERLNQACEGWMNNYRLANINAKVKKLDEWLRTRLGYCIWHLRGFGGKKLEQKRKNLIRLAVEAGQAYAWSRTRMGGSLIKKNTHRGFFTFSSVLTMHFEHNKNMLVLVAILYFDQNK